MLMISKLNPVITQMTFQCYSWFSSLNNPLTLEKPRTLKIWPCFYTLENLTNILWVPTEADQLGYPNQISKKSLKNELMYTDVAGSWLKPLKRRLILEFSFQAFHKHRVHSLLAVPFVKNSNFRYVSVRQIQNLILFPLCDIHVTPSQAQFITPVSEGRTANAQFIHPSRGNQFHITTLILVKSNQEEYRFQEILDFWGDAISG